MKRSRIAAVAVALMSLAASAAINVSEYPVRISGSFPDQEELEIFIGHDGAFTVSIEANEGYVQPAAMEWTLDDRVVWSEASLVVQGTTNLVYRFEADAAGVGDHRLAFALRAPTGTTIRSWKVTVPEPVPYTLGFVKNNSAVTGPEMAETNLWHYMDNAYVVPTPPWTLADSSFLGWATSPAGDIAYSPGTEVEDFSFGGGSSGALFALWSIDLATPALPAAVGGKAYQVDLEAVGGTDLRDWSWNFADAAEKGFRLDARTGRISDVRGDGSVMTAGSHPVTVYVTTGGGLTAARRYTLSVSTTYRVVFNPGSSLATGSMTGLDCRWDEPVRLPAHAFSIAGCGFLGWATEPFGEVVYTEGDEILNLTDRQGETVPLYACWDVGIWHLTFDSAGGSPVPGMVIAVGETARLPSAVPVREGWTFSGWVSPDEPTVYAAGADYLSARLVSDGGQAMVGEGRDVMFTARWAAVAQQGLTVTDASGNVWTYDRTGDEIVITHVELAPGVKTADVPATLNDGRVTNAGSFIVPVRGMVGQFGSWRLEEFGVTWPKAATVTAVKLETLPKGLKLVKTQIKSGSKVVETVYSIEGVPLEPIDVETQPVYARITSTIGKVKTEEVQCLAFEIVEAQSAHFPDAVWGEDYTTVELKTVWPDVAPTWTFKGWPAGLKYTAKAVPAKGAVPAVPAMAVYGKPTKAGVFEIIASVKTQIGKTSVTETRRATLNVWGAGGEASFRRTDPVDVPLAPVSAGPNVTAAAGMPTGVRFAAGLFSGTPTKAGVYPVTLTKADKTKEIFLWKVTPGANDGVLGTLDLAAAPVEQAVVQLVQGQNIGWSLAVPAGGKVAVSTPPAGVKLVQDKVTKAYSLSGVPNKAGVFVLTFKTTVSGVTRTERLAVNVVANPVTGTYDGVVRPMASTDGGEAMLVVNANGTAKLTLAEGAVKTTVSATGFTCAAWGGSDSPSEGVWQYAFALPAQARAALPARTAFVTLTTEPAGAAVAAAVDVRVVRQGAGSASEPLAAVELRKRLTSAVAAPVMTCVMTHPQAAGVAGEAAWAVALWDAKKGQFAVSGKLPAGKAFAKTVSPNGTGAVGDPVVICPFSAVDADKATYLVELAPDGTARLSGLIHPLVGEVLEGALAGFFGGASSPLPTSVGQALGAASATETVTVSCRAQWPGEMKAHDFTLKATGLLVNADFGSGFAAKDLKATVDKKTGLVRMTFKDGMTTYAFEVVPVSGGGGRLVGQVLRTAGKEKTFGTAFIQGAADEVGE